MEHKFWAPISWLLLIVMILVIPPILLDALSLGFKNWMLRIDEVLDVTFFATMAGLALATASLAAGLVSSALYSLKEEMDTVNGHKSIGEIERKAIVAHALSGSEHPYKDINDNNRIYCEAVKSAAEKNQPIISSCLSIKFYRRAFFYFLFGVVFAITIDPTINASDFNVTYAENTDKIFGVVSRSLLYFIDVAISVLVVLMGFATLLQGARRIQFHF